MQTVHENSALKPMRVGAIVDQSFRVLKQIIPLIIVPYAVVSLLETISQQLGSSTSESLALIIATVLVKIIRFSVLFYVGILVVVIGNDRWLGRSSKAKVLRKQVTFSLLGRVIIQTLIIWLASGAILGSSIALAFIMIAYTSSKFIALLLTLLGIVLATWIFVACMLSSYALIIDKHTIFGGIKKSMYLMRQGRWYSFKSPLMRASLIYIILVILTLVVGFLGGIGKIFAGVAASSLEVILSSAVMFATTLAASILGAFTTLALLGFYQDLKMRYEGTDLADQIASFAEKQE